MFISKASKLVKSELIFSDLKLGLKVLINLTFFAILFIFLLQIKSYLQIDIFPDYNFPLDEIISDLF